MAKIYLPSETKIRPNIRLIFGGMEGWGQFVCFSRYIEDSITAFTSYCKLKTVFCLNRARENGPHLWILRNLKFFLFCFVFLTAVSSLISPF